MYNLEQFLKKQLMAILEDVEMYSDFYEVSSEEYSNLWERFKVVGVEKKQSLKSCFFS